MLAPKEEAETKIHHMMTNLPKNFELIAPSAAQKLNSVAILRVRNEELILEDTLRHLSRLVDGIILLDDASTDSTFSIAAQHRSVVAIVRNHRWLPGSAARLEAETHHRQLLLDVARQVADPNWIMCADADERYIGPIKEFFDSDYESAPDYVRISLFDSYLTPRDSRAIKKGQALLGSRRFFGPERRDILMIFKNKPQINFTGLDAREPDTFGEGMVLFSCQHFGKSISTEQWEQTCSYYVDHFPWDSYGQKWASRRGKSIHRKSDFNRSLYKWGQKLFTNAVVIHPIE